MPRALATLLLVWLVAACSGTPPTPTNSAPPPVVPSASSSPGPFAAPTLPPTEVSTPTPEATEEPEPRRGIDVSHHQGPIDWPAVSRDRVDFAYLKATEGRTFTDPRFVENSREAVSAGLRVGAYHYFSLCSPGRDQAQHFVNTIKPQTATGKDLTLPAAVDLELLGSCSTPPERAALLTEVRGFIEVVEAATGQRVVVYSFPDFEERYGFAAEIDRRQWVRRLGASPPTRDWWLWQRSQSATIAGIAGPVDLNVLR